MDMIIVIAFSCIGLLSVLAIIWFFLPVHQKNMLSSILDLVYALIQVNIHGFRYKGKRFSYANEFEATVDKYPNRIQFISVDDGGRALTLADADILSNQTAHWLLSLGLHQKDTVALMMLNRTEYVPFWIGCSKIGVTAALINTNNTGKTLVHATTLSLQDSNSKVIVIDGELKDQVSGDIKELESNGIKVFFWDNDFIHTNIKTSFISRPSKEYRSEIKERDPVILIFTSGTTGLPKASKISHSRYIVASWPYVALGKLTSRDRIYTAMPLYHSAAGMLGVGSAIRSGACMVLRKKFSARSFASDCVKYEITSTQYIGELCRYLLAAPPSEYEAKLKLRTAFGNGMRPEVWSKFQERYHIKHIIEFYASTEGNLGLFNNADKVGALGFVPRWADIIYPIKLVRADPDDQTIPYRNEKGRCEVCKVNEVGLLIAPIDNNRIDRRFDGYTDNSATNKKIITNVFRKDDIYFNSGDLLYRDKQGFFFWSDRVGDTFRWKGENVSTSEVGEVIASCPGISDVTVYGVQIPGCDGRAGMAAIVLKPEITASTIDWQSILSSLSLHLPTYARPLFFRIQDKLATTSTFKHLKGDLVKEGFKPTDMKGDPIFFHSIRDKTIVPLTESIYNDIISGKIQC